MDFTNFKNWPNDSKSYTSPTKSNIVSRIKRANKILPIVFEPVYLFNLGQIEEFKTLSVNVKSQIRRAIRIYFEFLESEAIASNEQKNEN